MAAILDFTTFYHQTDYINGFPVFQDSEKHVSFMFLPFLANKICTLIYFAITMAAILDLSMFYHQTEYDNRFPMPENIESRFYSGSYHV